MARPDVGIVGLGLMGSNIAGCLLESGYDVVGFDLSESARSELESAGGTTLESPAAVADAVDVLITSLPNSEAVEAVYLGSDGIADATFDTDVTTIEMSTINPKTTRKIASELPALAFIDAPVSGGPEDCRDGSLMILVGGERERFERESVQTVLDTLGTEVFYAGDIGSGHTVKLLNNVLSMGNLLLAMEVVAMGVDAGIEPSRLNQILSFTGGASNMFRKRFPRAAHRNFEPGFTVEYAKKDLGLALDVAAENDVPMMVSSLIHQHYIEASARGYGEEDVASVIKLFEDVTGTVVEDEDVVGTFTGYGTE